MRAGVSEEICEAPCEEGGKYHMNHMLDLLLLMLHFSAPYLENLQNLVYLFTHKGR